MSNPGMCWGFVLSLYMDGKRKGKEAKKVRPGGSAQRPLQAPPPDLVLPQSWGCPWAGGRLTTAVWACVGLCGPGDLGGLWGRAGRLWGRGRGAGSEARESQVSLAAGGVHLAKKSHAA